MIKEVLEPLTIFGLAPEAKLLAKQLSLGFTYLLEPCLKLQLSLLALLVRHRL